MRIEASSINLAATRSYYEEQRSEETLEAWVGDERPQQGAKTPQVRDISGPLAADTIALSAKGLAARAAAHRARHHPAPAKAEAAESEQKPRLDAKLEALRMTIEMMTGKKIRIGNFSPHETEAPTPTAPPQPPAENAPERVGWGMIYEYHASHYEEETTSFSAEGVITTSDGKEINFKLDLVMHREFYESIDISIRAGDGKLVDPLVVNFGGTAAELTDTAFTFDIDGDGNDEEMARLGGGSGFLALDHNGDGIINDGSELFGPKTGDGFAELAQYDSDGNGWLDENDPVYNDLRLWILGDEGASYLETLASRGIGALLINSADTLFRLADSNNETLGQIRESSIFLRENGSVGTIQEVDVAV